METAEFIAPQIPEEKELSLIMKALDTVADVRQNAKVKYPIADIVLLVVAAIAGKAETWVDIEGYGISHAAMLKEYLHIERIPSHDTIQRVMQSINPDTLLRIYQLWCTHQDFPEETPESLKGHKLLNLDGKAVRGSAGKGKKAVHIVTAWDPQQGICRGQAAVDEKSNEITAIPKILAKLSLAGYIVTSDAMGTQKNIAAQIIDQDGDYVLALKGNQGLMFEDMKECAADQEFLQDIKKAGDYKKTVEKAHGQIEKREYWQTNDLDWFPEASKWQGLQSVVFERSTITKNGKVSVSWRFFITSLPVDIDMLATAIRGHWLIESMHHTLDATLKEDANKTLERTAVQNLNVIRKWILAIVRHIDVGMKASMRLRIYLLSQDSRPALEMLTSAG